MGTVREHYAEGRERRIKGSSRALDFCVVVKPRQEVVQKDIDSAPLEADNLIAIWFNLGTLSLHCYDRHTEGQDIFKKLQVRCLEREE